MEQAAEIFREFCAATDDSQEPRANFATIYISEAHAEDDWALPPPMARELGEGAHISLARTMADRIDAAKRFQARFQYRPALYCDSLSDDAMDAFQAWPERAFIFERGVCVFAGGKGPFDFDLAKVQAWLRQRFATSS